MADLQYYDVIAKPLMTEKSMSLTEERKYTFYVHLNATKTQVKEAVEKMFEGVKVDKVRTMLTHPKKRQRRGFAPGKTTRKKKAIVSLAAGSGEIDLFPGL